MICTRTRGGRADDPAAGGKLGAGSAAQSAGRESRRIASAVNARVFSVPNVRAGALFTAFVAEVAGGGDQDLEITVRGTAVTVTLSTPRAGGLTQRDFDVASRLEFPA